MFESGWEAHTHTHTHTGRAIDCIYAYGKRSHPLAFIIDNDTVDEA